MWSVQLDAQSTAWACHASVSGLVPSDNKGRRVHMPVCGNGREPQGPRTHDSGGFRQGGTGALSTGPVL